MRTVDPVKHQAKRRQILAAAVPLFAANGFDGTPTAEIARAAGMSSGNLFHYFSSKREIFVAIFEEDWDADERRETAARSAEDPWGALLEVVERLAAPAGEPFIPTLVVEAMIQARRDPEFVAVLERNDNEERAEIESLIVRATEAGQVDPPVDASEAAGWIQALIGSLFLKALDPQLDVAEQLPTLRLIVERFLRGEPR